MSEQARQAMRYRMAHDLWFAAYIQAARDGRRFNKPEPQLQDFRSVPS